MRTRLALAPLALLLALAAATACGGDEPATITKKGKGGGASGASSGAGPGGVSGGGASAAGASGASSGSAGSGGAAGGIAGGASGASSAGASGASIGGASGANGGASTGGGGGAANAGASGMAGSPAAGSGGAGAAGTGGSAGIGGGPCTGLTKTVPPSFAKVTDVPYEAQIGARFFVSSGNYLVLEGPAAVGSSQRAIIRVDPGTKTVTVLPSEQAVEATAVGNTLVYRVTGGVLKNVPVDVFTEASVIPDPRVSGKKVAEFAVDAQGLCWSEVTTGGPQPVRCTGAGAAAPAVVIADGAGHSLALIGGDLLHLVSDGPITEDHDLRVDAWKRDGSSSGATTWTTVTGSSFTGHVPVGARLAFTGGTGNLHWASSSETSIVEDTFAVSLSSDGTNAWGASFCAISRFTTSEERRLRLPIVPLEIAVVGTTVYVLAFADVPSTAPLPPMGVYQVSLADFEAIAE